MKVTNMESLLVSLSNRPKFESLQVSSMLSRAGSWSHSVLSSGN